MSLGGFTYLCIGLSLGGLIFGTIAVRLLLLLKSFSLRIQRDAVRSPDRSSARSPMWNVLTESAQVVTMRTWLPPCETIKRPPDG